MKKKIRDTIIEMSLERMPDKTVCPSEIAKVMFPEDWRNHMDEVRTSAIELYKEGIVAITQKGIPIDADHIKGPVRIKISRPIHK